MNVYAPRLLPALLLCTLSLAAFGCANESSGAGAGGDSAAAAENLGEGSVVELSQAEFAGEWVNGWVNTIALGVDRLTLNADGTFQGVLFEEPAGNFGSLPLFERVEHAGTWRVRLGGGRGELELETASGSTLAFPFTGPFAVGDWASVRVRFGADVTRDGAPVSGAGEQNVFKTK